jgi:hypothetical protein
LHRTAGARVWPDEVETDGLRQTAVGDHRRHRWDRAGRGGPRPP